MIKRSLENNYFPDKKFGSRHLDLFSHKIWKEIEDYLQLDKREKGSNKLYFNLSKLEWISHEALVYLTALFRYMYNNEIYFYIELFDEDNLEILNNKSILSSEYLQAKRKTKQTINLWEKWEIYSFLKQTDGVIKYEEYFNVDIDVVNSLRTIIYGKKKDTLKIYNWHKITPFTCFELNFGIENETKINYDLQKVFKLQESAFEILNKYQSETPFLNHSLSSIITKELYENSLDHAFDDSSIENKECYFGISLKNKLEIKNLDSDNKNVNYWLGRNFEDEFIPCSIDFFSWINKKDERVFYNNSYIEYTFLDFGTGIPKTLKEQYKSDIEKDSSLLKKFASDHKNRHIDTRVLEYAFDYSSSRHPIDQTFENRESIARGLFSLIDIVKKYKGLVIVRSNYGKIIYNFKDSKEIKNCVEYFDSDEYYTPGTLITIYIPETKKDISINSIKPQYVQSKKERIVDFIRIIDIQSEIEDKIGKNKQSLYNFTFSRIDEYLDKIWNKKTILYIDFAGSVLDSRSAKKILYYLASSPKVNSINQVIIINPISIEIVKAVQSEMISIYTSNKTPFLFNPIPCIFNDKKDSEYKIVWIGINTEETEIRLTKLLYLNGHDFRRDDFEKSQLIEGSFFSFDEHGNLKSQLPSISEIEISDIILRNTISNPNEIYLTSGNYYQNIYISLLESLQEKLTGNFLTKHLINSFRGNFKDYSKILTITLSSNVLGRLLISNLAQENINSDIEHIYLSNYHTYHKERNFMKIKKNDRIIIVTDVISTGRLIVGIINRLNRLEIENKNICVLTLVDNRKKKIDIGQEIISEYSNLSTINIYSCIKIEISKFQKSLSNKVIRRINPITNSVNSLSVEKSEINQVLFPNPLDFLKKINSDYLKIGNFKHDKNTHSYFIDTSKLFSEESGQILLKDLLQLVEEREQGRIVKEKREKGETIINTIKGQLEFISTSKNKKYITNIKKNLENIASQQTEHEISFDSFTPDFIFYPYYSGIDSIDEQYIINKIYPNNKVDIFQLPRFEGDRQWMFTVPPKFLNEKTKNKNVLIIDDGSSTGETIIQMIDEICFLDVKKIVVLSIIGKLNDYKREFLSRIKEIKVKKLNDQSIKAKDSFDEHIIPIHFYLGINLHIPVYSYFNEDIFKKEIIHIKSFLQIANLPQKVKLYVEYRIIELSSDNSKQIPNYFSNKSRIADIFLLRDAIGKIDGYKFYKEYFDFFDNLLEDVIKKEDDTQIEDIISIVIHERSLIEIIKNLLPDLYSYLRNYIKEIIIDKTTKKSNLSDYSLLRFYFIINYYEYFDIITEKLITKTLDFIKIKDSNIAFNFYIYILFTSFDISNLRTYNAIQDIINKNSISKKYYVGFKSLYNYYRINHYSLKDEKDSSKALLDIYTFEIDKKNHKVTLTTFLSHLRSKLFGFNAIDSKEKENKLFELREYWKDNIYDRLISIINHSKKIKGILETFNDSKFANLLYKHSDYNAEKVFYLIDELLNKEEPVLISIENVQDVSTQIDKLLIKRITNTSVNSFGNFAISYKQLNYYELWLDIISKSQYTIKEKKKATFNRTFCILYIHEKVISDVIFGEILENLKYANKSEPITYYWFKNKQEVSLIIENKVNKKNNILGSLNGIADMKQIAPHYNIKIISPDYAEEINEFKLQINFPYNR